MSIIKKDNLIALLEDGAAYTAAHQYLQCWEKGNTDNSQFTNWVLSARRSKLYYLYKACTHPDTENRTLASHIESMVCQAMSCPEVNALLKGAFINSPAMDELAEYLNNVLAQGCKEGRSEFLMASIIMSPEHVWVPALTPEAI